MLIVIIQLNEGVLVGCTAYGCYMLIGKALHSPDAQ